MANVLVGHRAVAARQIEIGAAAAFTVRRDDLIQIIDLAGKQVASVVAFGGDDHVDRLSTTVTITSNASLVLKTGDKLYSNRKTPLLELVDDTVGRHDLLTSPLPIDDTVKTPGRGDKSSLTALQDAATEAGVATADLADPVNFFKHVVVKQRGELDVRESFAERNDTIVLRALQDAVVVVGNAYPEKKAGVATSIAKKGRAGNLLVRVFR